MIKTQREESKIIFDTPTYHRGRSLEEQQERHKAGTGHTRVGELGARISKVTKLIHVFQECLDCAGVETTIGTVSDERLGLLHLETLDKKQLLAITTTRGLSGNKQTSKTKLIDTIIKSY